MYANQYQPMNMYQPYQQYQSQPSFQEVESIDSVRAIPMAPNTRSVYFDRHIDRFYTVETDAAGQKAITAYDFQKAVEKQPEQYVTTRQFDEWREGIEQLVRQFQDNGKQPAKSTGGNSRG